MAEMTGLSQDTIAALMANTRTRNQYGPKLVEFVESDEAAIDVAEVWPMEFAGKQSSTLYQGFLGAAKKAELDGTILVKQSDDHVFLLHRERVSLLTAPAADSPKQ